MRYDTGEAVGTGRSGPGFWPCTYSRAAQAIVDRQGALDREIDYTALLLDEIQDEEVK